MINMKIVEPSVKLLVPENDIQHVARCARVCYGKESGNDEKLYFALMQNKHRSMFRHETHYFIVPLNDSEASKLASSYRNMTDDKIIGLNIYYNDGHFYIVVNGQWCLEHTYKCGTFKPYEVSKEEFSRTNIGFNMLRYTFEITTQISTSRELNRVSPNNISEKSTRYVYEDGAICRPYWITKEEAKYMNIGNADKMLEHCNPDVITYGFSVCNAFADYKRLIDNGISKQDARGVLPLDTATKCVYTYSVDEWRHIIDLRYKGVTGKPHPNAYIIGKMLYNKFKKLGYNM